MKRTLLASAFAVMALAASAQVSEVTKVKGDGFGFIPKSLTTTGVITPYSTIGVENHSNENQTAEFTVYDASFNVAKTFSYEPKVFETKRVPMKALADFKTKEILDKGSEKESFRPVFGVYDYEKGFLVPVTTMDEFKAAIAKMLSGETVDFFTDDSGNFAFRLLSDELYIDGWGDDGVRVRESFYYYNSSDNRLYRVENLLKLVEVDTSNLAWTQDGSHDTYGITLTERIYPTEVYDYDVNCNEDSYGYLSQNVFNNDDKYEYLVQSYREVSTPTDPTGSYQPGLINISGIENGKIVLTTEVQDKYYEPYLVVKDEDGKDLFTVPTSGYKNDLTIYRANGKTYISNYESQGNGLGQYVIYLLDKTDTGITELARTQVVKSAKTFNMAGMLVGKNAKGLVIQQGGKKYFNK
ncbi:hypothetical protein KSW92_01910 [Prevotella copri]|uniref:hypothetical protein n=1 Tax=Segatella copri TaxID=165179 RepID=UPI001C38F14A|nr:hypothetical protein [Segatella copri]MBV3428308.1 hypothetical protein [Segatella copri]